MLKRSVIMLSLIFLVISIVSLHAERIENVEIVSDSSAAIECADLTAKMSGQEFTEERLEWLAFKIISQLENNGYPFAQVRLNDLSLTEGGTLNIGIEVTRGPLSVFDSAKVSGVDARTRDFLERIATIESGGVFSQAEIDRTIDLYKQMRYLNAEDSAVLDFHDDFARCTPTFHVTRKPTNLVEGSLGYQPGYADQDAYVRGYARVEIENILGRGRRFSIAYEKKNPQSHNVQMGFYQPFLFYQPLSLSAEIEQQKFDSLYKELSASSSLEYNEFGSVSVRVNGGWQRFTPEGSRYIGVFHARRWWWGAGVTLNSSSPRLKQSLELDISYGVKQSYSFAGVKPDKSRVDDTRLEALYNAWLPLSSTIGMQFVVDAAGIITDETDISQTDLYKLGGAKKLRGYREDRFLTERYVMVSLQPTFSFAANARFHLFADGAMFRVESGGNLERYGGGAGFVFDLPGGSLLIDAAWGKNDSLDEGKLYMILESRF